MIKHLTKKICAVFTAVLMIMTLVPAALIHTETASAASVDYPVVLLRISSYDNSRHMNISGYTDKSDIVMSEQKNTWNENWRLDYVGTDSKGSFCKITNMGTGRLITPMNYSVTEGSSCVIFGSESAVSQHWYVIPVDKDSYGTDLHYKIVNYNDTSLALTNVNNKIKLSGYSGKNEQKWLLNAAGEQGFGGYCKDMSGKDKASNIGGTLGRTVEVSTFDELKAACTSNEPCTIVITKNISKTGSYTKDSNGRYRFKDSIIYMQPNKTVVGSYGAHSLYNVYFRTYDTNYGPGHNLIFRNIQISHDKELNNDNIWEFAYGYNFWIDHCEFVGHSGVNQASTGMDDWDKFLNFKGTTDFVTISDCKYGLHEYGVLLGYPTDTQETYDTYNGRPCITLADNYYKDCITRAPGLMRYGYFHSFNNYVLNFDMGYTIYTACKLYAENNYYNGGTGKGSVVNDSVSANDISSKYPGQYTETGSVLTGSGYSLTAKTASACSWRPVNNYGYKAKSASDAKTYCEKYSGSQSSASDMTYASFAKTGYPSSGYVTAPSEKMEEPVQTTTGPPVTTAPAEPPKTEITGDVNRDGRLDASDVLELQRWFFSVPGAELADREAADINKDNQINILDFCLVKNLCVTNREELPVTTPSTTTPVTTVSSAVTTPAEPVSYEPEGFIFSGNVFLVGDSTVCDYDENYSVPYNRYGWGMKFAEQFNDVKVTNLALSGRSSRSFLAEKNYQTLKSSLDKGDYLFIQFGHNDEKTDETSYPGLGTYPNLDWSTLDNNGRDSQGRYSYEYILTAYYINLAKNKGAVPVLVTPITRRGTDGKPNYQQHTAYQQGMITIGKMYNVPVADMTLLTTQLYTNLYNYGGADETAKMHCYTDTAHTTLDNTHLSNAGAYKIADMIAEETQKLGLAIGKYKK
ncbi:MAG: GDSL-type esterase/lipase family protein [Oscillospiraceae bacterium]|nr:GDSL-type esterase/lipase family protein [Oscillospiraceae bacterium]